MEEKADCSVLAKYKLNKFYGYVPFVLVVIVVTLIFYSVTTDRSRFDGMNYLPELKFASLYKNDDSGFNTKSLLGQRYILHFFASWCKFCMEDHSLLLNIKDNVPLYGVMWKDSEVGARNWLARYGNPYRKVGFDVTGIMADKLYIVGVPETFVVDKDGKILFHHTGPVAYDDLMRYFE